MEHSTARVGVRGRRGTAVLSVVVAIVSTAGLALAACGDGGSTKAAVPVIDPGDGGKYHPVIEPANFVSQIDNPYLPLRVGSKWVYHGTGGEAAERTEVVVTGERRLVMGVSTVVVRDTVRAGDQLVEDTFDLFAQDRSGTVWYFGEEVKNYENGKFTNTHGSFLAGTNGALPGVAMPAHPTAGDAYRQEFYAGTAEDMGKVLKVDATRKVASSAYVNVVVTRDWTPLEPKVIEEKYYAPGVGQVLGLKTVGEDGGSELVEFSPGP